MAHPSWPAPVALPLPRVEDAGGLVAAMARWWRRWPSAEITPDEARTVAMVLSEQRAAIEVEDLSERLKTLEEAAPLLAEGGGG